MSTCGTGLRTVFTKAKEVVNAPFRMFSAWLLSMMTIPMTIAPTLCAKINTNLDLDTLFGNVMEIIIKLASYVGLALAAFGVFSWLLSMKDDGADQSRAIRHIVIGGALIGFRVILQLAGIIQ